MEHQFSRQVSADGFQEVLLKFTLVGCAGVGKTSILNKYTDKELPEGYKVTVGAEFGSKVLEIDDNTSLKLQIWDTAGQESFQSLVKSFYRDAHAIFLVYNVNSIGDKKEIFFPSNNTSKQTFEELSRWLEDISNYAEENAILVLIGNQVDKIDEKEVDYEEGLEFMKQNNFHYFFETSAVEGINIELAFMEAAKLAFINIFQEKLENIQTRNTIRLSAIDQRPKKIEDDLKDDNCSC